MSDLLDMADRVPPGVIHELEDFGYKREAVSEWSYEKAYTILQAKKMERRIALQRAATTAQEIDGTVVRGRCGRPERLTVAAYVDEAGMHGTDELLVALMYSLYALSEDELKRLAGYMVRVYRGEVGV